jgi:energy-coupling factor transporter ATP-binding protein EcfA2
MNNLDRRIRLIQVDRLFGHLTYPQLSVDPNYDGAAERILVLYGDNGCGKTTILRLLYHLLSPPVNRGHRSYLASTAFARFAVHLADGSIVSAERREPELVGNYTMVIQTPARENALVLERQEFSIVAEQKGDGWVVPMATHEERIYIHLRDALQALGLRLRFLTDDRRIDFSDEDDEQMVVEQRVPKDGSHGLSPRPAHDVEVDVMHVRLLASLRHVFRWLRTQVLARTSRGTQSVDAVYLNLIERLVLPESTDTTTLASLDELCNKLAELTELSVRLAELRLTPALKTARLIRLLREVPPDRGQIVVPVLAPYVESVEARLRALEPLAQTLSVFLGHARAFLGHRKTVDFDVNRGLILKGPDGGRIHPGQLSSGERQLFLLLSTAVASREGGGIFLIDEPELSLNIKWQRGLIQALLDCTHDTHIQIVVATHSIEVLTPFHRNVLELHQD